MKFLKLFAIALLIFALSSCSESVAIDMTASELTDAATTAVPLSSGYYQPSDAYFNYYFSEDGHNITADSLVLDWSIMKSSSQASENEIGVLVAKDGCIEQVKEVCREYLEERREAYLEAKASYSPGEYEKYRDAEYFTQGNYVIYMILDSPDRLAVRSAIEDMLEK